MLAKITLTYDTSKKTNIPLVTQTWGAMSSSTGVFKGTKIELAVNPSVESTEDWKIKKNSGAFSELENEYSLPNGNGDKMTLTLKCGDAVISTLEFVTHNND